jgi:hypothetical protein
MTDKDKIPGAASPAPGDQKVKQSDEYGEATVIKLLNHLQATRELIPVNLELKRDLKQELLKRMELMGPERGAALAGVRRTPRRAWKRTLSLGAAIASLFLIFFLWTVPRVDVQELKGDWFPTGQVALSPNGEQIASLDSGFVSVFQSEKPEITLHRIELPGSPDSVWTDPVWSPDSPRLSIVERDPQGWSRVWVVSLHDGSSRLLVDKQEGAFGASSWSPDGRLLLVEWRGRADAQAEESLLYKVRVVDSGMEIWGVGSQPAWSPDGHFVSFVRDSFVIIQSVDGKEERIVGEGEFPVWTKPTVLHYVSPDGKSLQSVEIEKDAPLEFLRIVQNELPFQAKQPIRISLSSDGKRMLWMEKEPSGKITIIRMDRRR